MPRPNPGEIWQIDLGLAAKVRPCLVLSEFPADDELALIVIIPHTTAVRHNRWEFPVEKPFLKSGVFHLQQIQPVSLPELQHKVGVLSADEFRELGKTLVRLLNLPAS